MNRILDWFWLLFLFGEYQQTNKEKEKKESINFKGFLRVIGIEMES